VIRSNHLYVEGREVHFKIRNICEECVLGDVVQDKDKNQTNTLVAINITQQLSVGELQTTGLMLQFSS